MSFAQNLRDFQLEKYFSRWEFTATHHLTASDAESMSLSELLELGTAKERAAFQDLHLGYTPTWGTDELREAIAQTYDHLKPADILAFAGAGEALFWATQLFLEPDDHAIATVPNYQSIESIPLAAGVSLSGMPLWDTESPTAPRGWTFDLEHFESLLRPNTRLLSVNFPNNPTGFVPPESTWRQLLETCHERRILVISDEVYRGIERQPETTLPQAADVTPSALSINVLSKAYGLPGLRIGWAACQNTETLERLERAKHYTSICNSAPSEMLAALALRHGERLLARSQLLVQSNLAPVADFMARHTDLFEYQAPDGGCVAFPRYLGSDGVEEFCRRAVEEHGVLLLPSSIYRSDLLPTPEDHFRIGIGRRNVPEGLRQLEIHLGERDTKPQ